MIKNWLYAKYGQKLGKTPVGPAANTRRNMLPKVQLSQRRGARFGYEGGTSETGVPMVTNRSLAI